MASDGLLEEDGSPIEFAPAIVAAFANQASIGDDPRSLAALSCWVYKSTHAGLASTPFSSPKPGSLLTYTDTLPNGGHLPAPANNRDGYDAVALYEAAARRLLLVNRGTETTKDWWSNIAAGLLAADAQVNHAVQFAVDAVLAVGAANISEVVCTGHSLGGGLADAQAALLNPALAARSAGAAPLVAQACGFSSAGFSTAIRQLANTAYGGHVDNAAVAVGVHYIRPNDPILFEHNFILPLARVHTVPLRLFQLIAYTDISQPHAPPGVGHRFGGFPFAHTCFLYFHLWKEGVAGEAPGAPARHVVRRQSGRIWRRDGLQPKKMDLLRTMPSEYL